MKALPRPPLVMQQARCQSLVFSSKFDTCRREPPRPIPPPFFKDPSELVQKIPYFSFGTTFPFAALRSAFVSRFDISSLCRRCSNFAICRGQRCRRNPARGALGERDKVL